MSREIKHLAPPLQELALKFLKECKERGLSVKIIQTWRTVEEQAKKYRCTRGKQEIMKRAERLTERGRPDLAEVLLIVGPQKRPDWLPRGHLTKAACGESKHHKMRIPPFTESYSFAFDFACYDSAGKYITDGGHHDYQEAGKIAEGLGLEWLGNSTVFKESAHVQMKGLPSTKKRLLLVDG